MYYFYSLLCFFGWFLLVQSQCNLVNRHTFGSKTSMFGNVTDNFSIISFKRAEVVTIFDKQRSYNPSSLISCRSSSRFVFWFKYKKIQLQQRTCLNLTIFCKRRLLFWTDLNFIFYLSKLSSATSLFCENS